MNFRNLRYCSALTLTVLSVLGMMHLPTPVFAQATGSGADGKGNGRIDRTPTPLSPNSPAPLSPIGPSPSAPTPSRPSQFPPGTYSQTKSAVAESVNGRSRPEYDASGVELDRLLPNFNGSDPDHRSALASFKLFPTINVDTQYDSNIFRSENATDDQILVISPEFQIRSDWANHSLVFSFGADVGRHARNRAEDYEDYRGSVNGILEVWDSSRVTGGFSLERGHNQRGEVFDANSPNIADGVTTLTQAKLDLLAEHTIGILSFSAAYQGTALNFKSTEVVDNEDLDRSEHTVTTRASVAVTEGSSFFVQPKFNWRVFDLKRDSSGDLQDNNGWEVLAGIRWDASSVTFAEAGFGYQQQSYDEATFTTIKGPTANVEAVWNATDLLTATVGLTRTISETADADLSGVLVTTFDGSLDFEYYYNTIISGRFSASDEDTQGSDKTDTRIEVGASVRHLLNEFFFLEFNADYTDLSSTTAGSGFESFIARFRIGSQI
ncbi:MAG: outer membrane beta-barrel protein [Alphaproteobacteria bacterium]|nr:outer membrane beta-barrel protein [Alphaproteobacteria bacterium]